MATRKVKIFYLAVTILLVMACVPTFAAPFPTVDPNAVNTFIAQTADAASTQTAAAQPTSTFTPTITPTRPTDTPSPTATSTVIFILSTPTQLVIPTFTSVSSTGGGGSGGSGDSGITSENYSCQIISVSPANGTRFNARDDFDAVWRVRNNGQRNWDRNSVDFIYDSGDRIHKVAGYDLNANVPSGDTINIGADMEAPRNSGTYTTYWTLRVGNNEFCRMSLTINVR
jgi:hypothetical protein